MFPFLFILYTISFFTALPVLLSVEDSKFSECSRPFKCGELGNISYPFWGNGRPDYCGHPDFELRCQNDSVEIDIQNQSYRIWNISAREHTLNVATVNTWQDDCPSSATNLSLLCNLFNCSLSFNQNITLAYGCSWNYNVRSVYQFRCSLNGVPGENYFWVDSTVGPDFWRCDRTIVLPVLRSRIQNLNLTVSTMKDVLKDGIIVGYGDTFCNGCELSGGQCGYQWSTRQPTCFCQNGSSQGMCSPSIAGQYP